MVPFEQAKAALRQDIVAAIMWNLCVKRAAVKASDLPVDIQLEETDIQCDSVLKDIFASAGVDTFYQ